VRIEGVTPTQLAYSSQRSTGEGRTVKEFGQHRDLNIQSGNMNGSLNRKINEEELNKAIESVNKSVNTYDRRLEFSIHETTNEIMVKVVDTNTDEVIREIPPEKILDMVAKLWEMAGIIVDKKV